MGFKLGNTTPGALRGRARPCWRKVQHRSEGAAEAALRSLRRRPFVKDEGRLNVYQCAFCGQWHTGRKREEEA